MKAYTPIRTFEKRSDVSYIISQEEATHNAVRFLYYIYSNTPREAISIDSQSYDLKCAIKILSVKSAYLLSNSIYAHLHPDPVGYYIYTLEKIII